jgi:hypothetical protein
MVVIDEDVSVVIITICVIRVLCLFPKNIYGIQLQRDRKKVAAEMD